MSCFSKISYCSSYIPEKRMTNYDISKLVDTCHEWIETRTGIVERRIAANDESTSSMAIAAVRSLLEKSGVNSDEIDLLVVATTTPDFSFPSVACMVQGALGLKGAVCFDVSAACSGFIYAISVADTFIRSGNAKKVVVVGADKMSSLIDWNDRSTCILFGDGAGCVMLEPVTESQEGASCILKTNLYSDGDLVNILKTSGGVSTSGSCGFVEMNGREVFKNAVIKMTESTKKIISELKISSNDIDWVVPHQANRRIIESVMANLSIPVEKAIITIDKHGNTSAASIPLALDVATNDGRVKKGDVVLFQAVGGGLTWGCSVVRI